MASSRSSSETDPLTFANRLRHPIGVTTATADAVELIACYRNLASDRQVLFQEQLYEHFSSDPSEVDAAIDLYRGHPTDQNLQILSDAVEAPRQEIFRLINTAPGGTAFLMHLREQILGRLASQPMLRPVEADLFHLLSAWFNRGFLELRAIDWSTPAHILEKLIAYEAVHEIQGWGDLRRRLASDRRCFGFFHPVLPDEPIIFVEVALTTGLADSIQDLLERRSDADLVEQRGEPSLLDDTTAVIDPRQFDTAIFYSITNCQRGLQGISFGDVLIKQVTEVMSRNLPHLETFATLSPIPGLVAWARTEPLEAELLAVLDGDGSPRHLEALEAHRETLLHLSTRYLLSRRTDGTPVDSVARFHLRNGARLDRVNWKGDISTKGLAESAGMLVNYVYDAQALARNHQRYLTDKVISHSEEIRLLSSVSSRQ